MKNTQPTASRWTTMSIPGHRDEPATWFAFDLVAMKSVRATDYADAVRLVRAMNAKVTA